MATKKKATTKTRRRQNLRTSVFKDFNPNLSPITPDMPPNQKFAIMQANQNKLLSILEKIIDNG